MANTSDNVQPEVFQITMRWVKGPNGWALQHPVTMSGGTPLNAIKMISHAALEMMQQVFPHAEAAIEAANVKSETVHLLDPDGGPSCACCGLAPKDVPKGETVTTDPARVTCMGLPKPGLSLKVVPGRGWDRH